MVRDARSERGGCRAASSTALGMREFVPMRREDPAEAYSPAHMGRATDAYARAVLRAMPLAFVGVLLLVVVCLLLKIDRLVSAFIATTGMFAIYFWRGTTRAACPAPGRTWGTSPRPRASQGKLTHCQLFGRRQGPRCRGPSPC